MVVRDDATSSWSILNGPLADSEVDIDDARSAGTSDKSDQIEGQVGSKRPSEAIAHSSEDIRAKRPRTTIENDTDVDKLVIQNTCLAPPRSKKARMVLEAVSRESPNFDLGAGDIFLTDGWRTRWCHCESVSLFRNFEAPFLP